MDARNVGALETLFSQGRGDLVQIEFDDETRRFVATLFEDYDPDGEGGDELGDLEESEGLSPASYEMVEHGEDDGGGMQHHRELVSASGETMVEALLQLELAYRNLLGINR